MTQKAREREIERQTDRQTVVSARESELEEGESGLLEGARRLVAGVELLGVRGNAAPFPDGLRDPQ